MGKLTMKIGSALILASCFLFFAENALAVSDKRFVNAVEKGRLEKVQKYLSDDVSESAARKGLAKAMRARNEAMIEVLLDHVAPNGDTLNTVIWYDRLDLAERLRARGAVITDIDWFLAVFPVADEDELVAYVEFSDGFIGQQAMVAGLRPEGQMGDSMVFRKYESPDGQTPLTLAAERGFDRLVAALLAKGADPNVVVTVVPGGPLNQSLSIDNLEVGSTLTIGPQGAGTIVMPGKGTALTIAVQNEHAAIVRRLLAAGANPLLPLHEGASACELAEGKEIHREMAEACAGTQSN